ncbi:hypothetical protein MUB24_15535 [Lederbergia sp. NSJ-179]|uniref:hypothetical protein n=1 Tax=Lederbergia sp. NSJ-179 TaxID=2931402 RepID=UPI001FD468E1|nr:hypothetical protein [Lederbergia sp. NSJ-179]MCJ7842280.1 hypothetical protein [Lederbergia sp. NSJ-179]
MNDTNFIRRGLSLQNFPAYETDIPYIYRILNTINRTQASLEAFPFLNEEVPIMVVDKELLQ